MDQPSSSSAHSPSVEKLKLDIPVMPADLGASIPDRYSDNRFVSIVRDPHVFFCYWDLTWDRVDRLKKDHGDNVWDVSALVLRVYDLSEAVDGITSAPFFDVEIHDKQARQSYVHVPKPGHAYITDLGLRKPDGLFLSLLTSNRIQLPFGRVSDKTDSHWMAVTAAELQQWNKLVLMSGAVGADVEALGGPGFSSAPSSARGSSEFARAMALRWEFLKAVFSGSASSWSHSSAWASKPAEPTEEKKS